MLLSGLLLPLSPEVSANNPGTKNAKMNASPFPLSQVYTTLLSPSAMFAQY
jgi:hypothetical protein